MTKVTIPEPAFLMGEAAPNGEADQDYYTLDQMEAYAAAKVREALEEAAQVCWKLRCSDDFEPEIQDRMLKQAENQIRALIHQP